MIGGKQENIVEKKAELDALFKAYSQWFVSGFNDLIKPCLDAAHLNTKLKQYVFKPYAWMTYELGDDRKVVNDYCLPRQYWEPFLKHAAAQQARDMNR